MMVFDGRVKRLLGAVVLCTTLLTACIQDEQSESVSAASGFNIPDISSFDPPVREQITQALSALEELQQQEQAEPSQLAWAYGNLGRVLHAYRFFEQATQAYQQAKQLQPKRYEWFYLSGHVLRTLGQYKQAKQAFMQALVVRSNDIPTLIWLAETDLMLTRIDQAGTRLNRILEMQPDHVYAQYSLGRVAMANQQYRVAVEYFLQALQQQPQASQVLYQLGQAYQLLGLSDEARQVLSQIPNETLKKVSIRFDDPLMQSVSDLRISSQVLMNRANKAIRQGEYRLAESYLNEAIAANPDRVDTRVLLAQVLINHNKRAQAVSVLQDVLVRAPSFQEAYSMLIFIQVSDGQLQQASNTVSQLLEIAPQYAQAHFQKGRILLLQNQHEAALSALQQCLQYDPDHQQAAISQITVMMALGQYEKAHGKLSKALQSSQTQAVLKLLMARLLSSADSESFHNPSMAAELTAQVQPLSSLAFVETKAMVHAAEGEFDRAALLQRELLSRPWLDLDDQLRVKSRADNYSKQQLNDKPWYPGETLARFNQDKLPSEGQ